MTRRQYFPRLWLISDARNDPVLDIVLAGLPRGSGFIYRHYHLEPTERVARFHALAKVARRRGHLVILADSAQTATEWGADGIYGAARALDPRRADLIRLATAHSAREIAEANRSGADAVLLAPAFQTRTHPGAPTLGPLRFRMLAAMSRVPVIALGGMTQKRADRLQWPLWAAIDGLS